MLLLQMPADVVVVVVAVDIIVVVFVTLTVLLLRGKRSPTRWPIQLAIYCELYAHRLIAYSVWAATTFSRCGRPHCSNLAHSIRLNE